MVSVLLLHLLFAEQGATICFNDINQELVDKGLASYAEKRNQGTRICMRCY